MKVKGRVVAVARSIQGRPLLTIECAEEDALTLTDEEYVIEFRKERKKRSLDANAYAWVLIGKLSELLKLPKVEVYRQFIARCGRYDIICCPNKAVAGVKEEWERKGLGWIAQEEESKLKNCTNLVLYYGTSSYDTAQMSIFIDEIVESCKEQGISTETPEELARMKEEWK